MNSRNCVLAGAIADGTPVVLELDVLAQHLDERQHGGTVCQSSPFESGLLFILIADVEHSAQARRVHDWARRGIPANF